MKLTILILIILIQGYYSAAAQNFIIKRTDVNNDSAKFVTATYNFSYEILLEGVPNSNSISFKLNYDMSDYVKFSQWKRGDYDVLQAVNIDNGDGTASLIIGVSSGLVPQSASNLTPKVIELEFVVVKNAPNLANLNMTFERPVATALDTAGGVWIPVNSINLNYSVHSYVNVWPGDTDNSGAVDHLDFVAISQYIGMGSATKGLRSFKRQASSSLWTPQRVLTWDSASVTFVDCDGNGDITTTDMLIVTYNLGKDTLNPHGSEKGIMQPKEISTVKFAKENSVVYPLKVQTGYDFTGAAGSFEIPEKDFEFVGIDNGNIFNFEPYLHFYKKDNLVYFVISNENLFSNYSKNDVLMNLVFEKKSAETEIPDISVKELLGINSSGNVFPLSTLSSVKETPVNVEITVSDEFVEINSENIIDSFSMYDIMGNPVKSINPQQQTFTVNIDDINSGLYFLKIGIGNKEIFRKISVVR